LATQPPGRRQARNGVTTPPEQQDIVTGAVLVGTLIIFRASRNVGEARSWFARLGINWPEGRSSRFR
jgi:hypothetical protein